MAGFYTAALNAIHNSILFGLQICAFNAIRNSQFHTLWPSELYFGNLGWFLMWMSHKCTFCAFEICTFGIRGGFCGVHMLSDPSNETHASLLNPLFLVLFGLPPCVLHLSAMELPPTCEYFTPHPMCLNSIVTTRLQNSIRRRSPAVSRSILPPSPTLKS